MNSHVNTTLPYGGNFYSESLYTSLQKHGICVLITLTFALMMVAILFVPSVPISALIPSFYIESAAIGLGLLATLLLLRADAWRPFYFPMVAWLPITLTLLIATQIALNLMAYWQQHVFVIVYLIWATLLVILGAELSREFDLKKIAPLMAGTMLLMGLFASIATILLHWSPNFLGTGMALVSLVYTSASKRIAKGICIILGCLIIGATAYAIQANVSALPQNLSFLQHNRVLAKESWHIFLANPLLGAGWGQFAWQDLQLANEYSQHTGIAKHPQNFMMQLLAETGIAGFAIVVIGLGLWLKRIWQPKANLLGAPLFQNNQASANLDKRWLYACLVLIALAALFNNALASAPVLGFAALTLGLLEERIFKLHSNIGAQFKDAAVLGRLSIFVVLAIGALALIGTCRQYATLERWHNNTAKFTQFKSQQILPILNTLGALRHQSLLAPYIDMGIVRALPNNADLIQDKLAINSQLIRQNPQAAEAYTQAELLALAGQSKLAKKQLQLAINRHPDHLYGFSMKLLKAQNKEVLPLLFLIVRHNKKEITNIKEGAIAKQAKKQN